MNCEYLLDKVFTVSEIGQIIKETVSEMFYGLNVEGEVCNFRTNQSKHWYFSIKDKDGSLLNCTCFAGNNWKERRPENGELVVLKGSLSFWPKGGSLTFNAESIRLKGEGDLRLEIEKRRAYYKSLGYFDDDIKKPLPENISTIGIITSAEGAVIHDIMNVTKRRAPSINLLLFPSLVQGKGAEENIAMRIRQANNFSPCDLLIVCRGGGSEEDLAPYSSTAVIEAIHDSILPVISAVGHDSDFPLSDFVADLRAPTPSAAAELVTEGAYKKRLMLERMEKELHDDIKNILLDKKLRLSNLKMNTAFMHKKLERYKSIVLSSHELRRIIRSRMNELSYEKAALDDRLNRSMEERERRIRDRLRESSSQLSALMKDISLKASNRLKENEVESRLVVMELFRNKKSQAQLLMSRAEDLSPLSILERGYSIMTDEKGRIVKSISQIEKDDNYTVRLSDGYVFVKAEDKNEL